MNEEMKAMVVIEDGANVVKLLEDVFTDKFMQENTRFSNFEEFRFSSAVFINWKAEKLVYSPMLLDGFVRESTDFGCFDDMVRVATDIRFAKE